MDDKVREVSVKSFEPGIAIITPPTPEDIKELMSGHIPHKLPEPWVAGTDPAYGINIHRDIKSGGDTITEFFVTGLDTMDDAERIVIKLNAGYLILQDDNTTEDTNK